MTIIMIEATAEELRANRTVMDSINEALNRFADNLCGVNNIDFAKAMMNMDSEDSEESEE